MKTAEFRLLKWNKSLLYSGTEAPGRTKHLTAEKHENMTNQSMYICVHVTFQPKTQGSVSHGCIFHDLTFYVMLNLLSNFEASNV